MYDNHSTDGSQALAESLGFEIVTFGQDGRLDDEEYRSLKNNIWKEERWNGQKAHYVIVCDADEFLSIPPAYLSTEIPLGTAPIVQGFNMISEVLPVNDIFEINTGEPSVNYSKQAIFAPREIEEINFVHGCHKNYISGNVTTHGFCTLHHFRCIGGVQRLIDRHAEYRPRLSKFNLKHGMGVHYGRPEWTKEEVASFNEAKRTEWELMKSTAISLW